MVLAPALGIPHSLTPGRLLPPAPLHLLLDRLAGLPPGYDSFDSSSEEEGDERAAMAYSVSPVSPISPLSPDDLPEGTHVVDEFVLLGTALAEPAPLVPPCLVPPPGLSALLIGVM